MLQKFTFLRAGMLAIAFMCMAVVASAQTTVSGTVLDGTTDEPLIGASVSVKGTSIGTTTDLDGKYTLKGIPAGSTDLVVSFIGYTRQEIAIGSNTVIDIKMKEDANVLSEIVVTSGVIDFAKTRETPIAVSAISTAEIALKVGNLEFPEIMNRTPGVYATKTGGGYGDSRISLRGFDQWYSCKRHGKRLGILV